MSLLGDFAAYVDSLKRTAGNSLRDLWDDPQGLLSMRAAQLAESLPAIPQSVMPGVDSAGLGPMRPTAQDWSMGAAMNAPTMGLLGHTVYHGSPHKFDRFDASKIGTGEGAQAYGHGIYFAERPGVARSYAETLSERQDPRGEINALFNTGVKTRQQLTQAVTQNPVLGPLVKQEPAFLRDILEYHAGQNADGSVSDAALRAAGRLDAQLPKPKGNFYQVDLPDEWLPKMLDWDKPLSQQAHGETLRRLGKKIADEHNGSGFGPTLTPDGTTVYRAMDDADFGGQWIEAAQRAIRGDPTRQVWAVDSAKVSEMLRAAGIPGVRYLDQGSRAAGNGTYNYVVFPGMEHLLKILSRE